MQLHISEKSGRGVPRIVSKYGENAFKFSNNAITVTIPYNRLDLGGTPQVTPQVIPQDVYKEQGNAIENKIAEYCVEARSVQEILAYLDLKDRKNLMVYIRRLLSQGRLARTIPDKPKSRNQKYITIK